VRAVGDAPGVVILACDQPAVTAEHLRLLAEGGDAVVASAYAGRKGVPVYFPARVFGALLALQGDTGARVLLREARAVELPGGELDVDTIQDLELAQRLYERPAKR
jgi:molybdenum cofactor cytidylyltransferase